MAEVQIPDLTAGTTLDGTEQFESVQNGSSVRLTSAQIAAYAQSTPGADLTFVSPLIRNVNEISLTTVPITLGGTGLASVTENGVIYGGASTFGVTAEGATGQVLTGVTGGPPVWAAAPTTSVNSVSGGSTGLTPASPTGGDIVLGGAVNAASGGTGQTSYTIGDILYASAATTLAKLASVATGNVLLAGGVATAPSWGKVNLATAVSGSLPAANGGVGFSTYAVGDLLYADTTSSLGKLADIATGNALLSGGVTTAPAWGKIGLTTHVTGTLAVGNGGTGAATLSGVLKGNATSAIGAATAGSDYVAPATATTFTALQTFNGTSSVGALALRNALEDVTVSASSISGTINYDITTQSVTYYTGNAGGNWTVNFRGSSGTSLNTLMATNKSYTVALLVTQGSSAFYNNAVTVDGGAVTPEYQGGTAWSSGNANSVDVYVYTIIKTGAATFKVFASQSQFA
jgi:hypothetical protein